MHNLTRRHLLLALPALSAARALARAQQEPKYSSEVKIVNVVATVRRKNGEIVRDLAQDDFTIEEDGKPQTIKYFSHETDLPLTLGLLVDTSMSQRRVLGEEESASYRFLDKVLREDRDVAFLIHFDFDVELLQDLTSSKRDLQKALALLQTPELNRRGSNQGSTYPGSGGGYPGGGGGYPGGGGRRRGGGGGGGGAGGGTALYDSVLLASDEVMKRQKGRKAVILLTDGVDTGSKVTLPRAIESAQRADTLCYSLLFSDGQAYGSQGGFGGLGRRGGIGRNPGGQQHPDGKKVLQQLAQETGGGFFEVSKKKTLDEIYTQLQEELRSQYSMGYTPDDSGAHFGGYRHIKVTTKKKDLIVQAREGYYTS